ncbi:DUF6923 family protein [Paenibacillus sp. NPDC056722]|uniref:DUF6923 family protein n=1 Tax=Paenibacillus sp. NPDC056722 TaxID=3345924 RepID=UPI0036C8578C
MKVARFWGLVVAGVMVSSSVSMSSVLADPVEMENPGSDFAITAAAEPWHEVSKQTFWLLDALERGQGVTTDGNAWIFSSPYGLLRTALDGKTVIARNPLAIPPHLSALGGDHIGDISYYNGTLYVPIEDGKKYEHPYIALFDANTLQYTGTSYALPLDLHPGGVPWVAVDAARGQVYTAKWNNADVLNVFSLDDMHLIKTVPLSQSIDRVQGAAMYNGSLYASSDNKTQTLYRVDVDNGNVSVALDRNLPSGTEAQGIAVLPTADGAQLHILDVGSNRVTVNFRHYSF